MKLRTTRALAITMAVGILASTAPAATAANVIEITPPDREWGIIHPSAGVVSASISEADQQRLHDAGYDVTVRPDGDNVSIDWTADEQRVREVTGLVDGAGVDGDPIALDADLGVLADNIHEKAKPAPYPTMRAGEDSAYRSLAYLRDEHTAISAASISSWRHGGVDGLTEVSTTTDTYREYNPERQARIEQEGRRGHYLPNLSQCYDRTGVCGFWLQPTAWGSDPEVEGVNGTMRAVTDAIWVSVDTKAGLPEPADYTDMGGHIHRFTLDTAATGRPADALSTPWRPAPGRDEQNRVLPFLEVERSWVHTDGNVDLRLRSTIPVSQRMEVVDAEAGDYRYIISAGEDLDGRQWRIRTDSNRVGEVIAKDARGRTVTSDITVESLEGQDVVLRLRLSSGDESITPRPRLMGASIGIGSGGQPAQTASWQQPVYTQETEFVMPPLPEPEFPEEQPPPSGPRPPRDASRIPVPCSGGWLAVAAPTGTAGYIAPDGTYYPDLTLDEVSERVAAAAPEGGYCPTDDDVVDVPKDPQPPVEQPVPPVVDVPEMPLPPIEQPEPPVVDVPEVQPEPETPIASPEPPVTVVDQPRLDPAPQPETEPEVVVTPAPVAEDKPEFLTPVRPETGVDGISAHAGTDSSPSPSLLSLLIAAATAVAGVVLYSGARPVRLGRRRYQPRHARD